MVYTSREKRSP